MLQLQKTLFRGEVVVSAGGPRAQAMQQPPHPRTLLGHGVCVGWAWRAAPTETWLSALMLSVVGPGTEKYGD